MSDIIIINPTRHDFDEDWTPEALKHGLYTNDCRACGATIHGHKYRRTCRVCVEIFKKQAAKLLSQTKPNE